MSVASDFFAQKTPAELQFFVDNPTFYEPDLVTGAARELRRRGLGPARPAFPEAAPAAGSAPVFVAAEGTPRRPGLGLWLALLALAAALLAGGLLWRRQRAEAAARATVQAQAAAARKAPPQLEAVPTTALPDFSAAVAASVRRQLARVPAAEKAALAAQPQRQYRELSRRFWAAETMSEYLVNQARQRHPNPMLAEQAVLAREAWQQWNHAAVYRYHFPPALTDHLDRMGRAASLQQHILAELPELVAQGQLLATPEQRQRDDELQDLLGGLLPTSPVTDRPYRRLHRRIQLQ